MFLWGNKLSSMYKLYLKICFYNSPWNNFPILLCLLNWSNKKDQIRRKDRHHRKQQMFLSFWPTKRIDFNQCKTNKNSYGVSMNFQRSKNSYQEEDLRSSRGRNQPFWDFLLPIFGRTIWPNYLWLYSTIKLQSKYKWIWMRTQ